MNAFILSGILNFLERANDTKRCRLHGKGPYHARTSQSEHSIWPRDLLAIQYDPSCYKELTFHWFCHNTCHPSNDALETRKTWYLVETYFIHTTHFFKISSALIQKPQNKHDKATKLNRAVVLA